MYGSTYSTEEKHSFPGHMKNYKNKSILRLQKKISKETPGNHIVEKEIHFLRVGLGPPHMCHQINKYKGKKNHTFSQYKSNFLSGWKQPRNTV